MTTWTDTPQQKACLRQSRIARAVRRDYPQGQRIASTAGREGTVYRHVPGTNAQGGHLVVDWDTGGRGRVSPINVRPI